MNIMQIGCYIFLSDGIHILTNALMLLDAVCKPIHHSVAAIV